MKEFIEKLIGRLEEREKYYHECALDEIMENGHTLDAEGFLGKEDAYGDAISIVNQLAEEHKVFGNSEQVNDGWVPCSSGEMPKCGEFDIKNVWVTMHRKGVDFYFTRKICWNNYLKRWEWSNGKKMADDWEIIAWQYLEVPAPYQPKGE